MKKKKFEKHLKKTLSAFFEKDVEMLSGYSFDIVRSHNPKVFDVVIRVSAYDKDIQL